MWKFSVEALRGVLWEFQHMKSKQRKVGVVRFYLNDCGLMGGSTVAGYSEELKMLNTYIHTSGSET